MAQSNTYSDGSVKESVLNLISVINPDETRLLNSLQRTRAAQPVHQWLKQDIAQVDTTNTGIVEGADAGTAGSTDPARLTNYTQIFRKIWSVTDTQKASAHYAQDAKVRVMDEAMRVLGNQIEFALMRGASATAGDASTARTMKGIKAFITTNAVAGAGASFAQSNLEDLLQDAYTAGGSIDSVYTGGVLKRRIDSFTAGNTRQIAATDNRLVASVNVYESSFGIVKIFLHRYVTISGDTNNDVVALDTKRWAIAVLRDPKNIDLAKTGSADKGMFEGELTLEARNEKSSAKATNFI